MTNEVRLFENPEFGSVRTTIINGEPWFVGKDVADILGYAKSRNALATHVEEDDALKQGLTDSLGREQETTFINESGLYSLILGSKLSKAKEFKKWVTSEVLPDIRKHGMYMTNQTAELLMNDPRAFAQVLTAYADAKDKIVEQQKEIEAQATQIEEMKPKASYHDHVLKSKNAVNISVIAKDYSLSATTLNKMLHEYGIQYKQGSTWLLYQKYANMGLTKSNTITYTNSADEICSAVHTKWTQKGRLFIYKLLKEHDILPEMEQEEQVI